MIVLEIIIGSSIGAAIAAVPCIKRLFKSKAKSTTKNASTQTEADESPAAPAANGNLDGSNFPQAQTFECDAVDLSSLTEDSSSEHDDMQISSLRDVYPLQAKAPPTVDNDLIQAPAILAGHDLPVLTQYEGTCACHERTKCPFISTYPSLYRYGAEDCALDNLDRFDIVLRALLNFDGTVQASDTYVAEAAVLGSDLDSNDEAFLYALRSLGYVEATN